MTQSAMKPPTCVNDQPSTLEKKIGTLTTNQTSRAANKARRANDSRLMPEEFDRMPENAAFFFAWPIDAGSEPSTSSSTMRTAAAMASSALRKPNVESSSPPAKNPAPFSAFFEPVSTATHLNKPDSSPAGTSTLTALFALIFV